MKTVFSFLFFAYLMATSNTSFASEELPFDDYYGNYRITDCKRVEATNLQKDYCTSKLVRIERSPACSGVPITRVLFVESEKQYEFAPCTRTANIPAPIQEGFSSGQGLNPEFFKYGKEEDGVDHYYIRSIADGKTHVYTDSWMKTSTDKSLNLRLKRRETSIDEPQKNLMSFEYEFTLKKIK